MAILVIRRYINITSSTINVCWLNPQSVLFSNNCTSSCLPLPGCCLGSHIWLFNTNRLGIIFCRGGTVEAIEQIIHAVADWYQHDICDYSRENLGYSLRWRHNGRDTVSNHQPHDCLLNRLFRRRSKKTSKLRVTGLCAGNWPGTGEFPAQMASNAENASIWWRHHGFKQLDNPFAACNIQKFVYILSTLQLATAFFTCHYNTAVLICAKFRREYFSWFWWEQTEIHIEYELWW